MAVAHRIYAEALFGAADDAGRLGEVHEALADFATAVEESAELRSVLRNPQIESVAKGQILGDLVGEEEPLFANFLHLVAEKGRAGEIDEIAREFERLMARKDRRLSVELTTARELSDAEADAILAQIEDAAGRKVDATRRVDPAIVGGIVLQAGSYRVDASVRGRLERLQTRTREELRRRLEAAPGRDHVDPAPEDRAIRRRDRPRGGRQRPADRGRHRPHLRARERHRHGDARARARRRRHSRSTSRRTTSEPRSSASGSSSAKASRCAAPARSRASPSARPCSAASSTRSATRSTARARSRHPRPARSSSRRRG